MAWDKDKILWEIRRSIVKNWLFYGFLFVLSLYWMSSRIDTMIDVIEKNTALQEKSMQSVIGLTDSGIVVDIERRELFADNEEALVVRALRMLVAPRVEITNGFSISSFKSPTDILKSTEKLSDFSEYLVVDDAVAKDIIIDTKNYKGEVEKKTALELSIKGVGFFTGYLEKLKQMIFSETLPHFATIYKTEIRSYEPNGNRFKIKVIFLVTLQNWMGTDADNNNIYSTTRGKYEIEADGYFDIKLRTKKNKQFKGINKLGLHFYKLKILIPTIAGKVQ